MKKFRVLSDLHLDPEINGNYPLEIKDKDVFTVICGDTAGEHQYGYEWIAKNVKNGILVNGNHMPYNFEHKTMQEQREELAKKYPLDGNVTYLDAEIDRIKKEVDGIVFLGSCMYSNMRIAYPGNPSGDPTSNKMVSHRNMNDFRYGIKEKVYDFGLDNEPRYVKITPQDYQDWFINAFKQMEKFLSENEASENPKPVVLVTHYPLIKTLLENSYYESVYNNYASYGSDMEYWIKMHPSIKCYCCGHAHDIDPKWRHWKLDQDNGSKCLVVNNARGYEYAGHAYNFNPNTFVNTTTWEIEQDPMPEKKTRKLSDKDIEMLPLFF